MFAYSLLGKAFEKQTITIKDQGVKQINEIEDNKKQLDNKQLDNKQQGNNEFLHSKEEKYLRIFTMKDSIKKMNYLQKWFWWLQIHC